MRRRDFIRTAGAGGVALVAGCTAEPVDSGDSTGTKSTENTNTEGTVGATTGTTDGAGELVVATYSSFVDAPSSSPGAWLKKAFESEVDATLTWRTPENGVNHYVERQNSGAGVDADVYVGLDTNMLIRVDEKLKSGSLFAKAGDVEGASNVDDALRFDPKGRAIPYDTGYISLVYDENKVDAAETFDGLAEQASLLIAQDPTSSATGKAFLLHTIKAKGADGYLDYWQTLQDNGVTVLGTWDDAYTAYSNGEAPMVVSYSTDQVYANEYDADMSKHQIRFLNGQGYANPEGMALFADANAPALGRRFLSFMLRPKVQAEIAVRNVQFPATTNATLPKEYTKYAKAPDEPVTFTYEELKGNLSEWTDQWARQFASK